jgi:hypothetical protein
MPVLLALSLLAADLSGNATFVAALDSYRQLDFEIALQKLEEVTTGDAQLPPSDLAVVQVWRGIVLSQLGENEAAGSALRAALELDRSVVTPADAPPSVVQSLEELRKELAPVEPPPPPPDDPKEPAEPSRFEDPMFLTGAGLVGGGALLAVTGTVGLLIVDAQVGAPASYDERVGLGNVGVGLLVTAVVGLGAAGAGAAILTLPAE